MIKRFRTDNGGEYVNAEMLKVLTRFGIKHDRTRAYPHESKGIVERYNRTIITATRPMLTGLPVAL